MSRLCRARSRWVLSTRRGQRVGSIVGPTRTIGTTQSALIQDYTLSSEGRLFSSFHVSSATTGRLLNLRVLLLQHFLYANLKASIRAPKLVKPVVAPKAISGLAGMFSLHKLNNDIPRPRG